MKRWAPLAACLQLCLLGSATAARAADQELVVEAVQGGSLGERAGLRPGDRLSTWLRDAAFPETPTPGAGRLATPFDLRLALIEEAPRGALRLCGRRGESRRCWALLAGATLERVGLEVRPPVSPSPGRLESSWTMAAQALAAAQVRDYRTADAAFAQAVPLLTMAGRRREAADLLVAWGASLDERGSWAEAAVRCQRGLGLLSGVPGSELLRARAEHALGEIDRHRDDYPHALVEHAQAQEARVRAAPRSLDASESLLALARSRNEGGSQPAAASIDLLLRAISILEPIDHGSLAHARLLDYLGILTWNGGRIFAGERLFEQSYRMASAWAPRGYETARALLHLGTSLDRRGDMVRAERLFTESLSLWNGLPATTQNRRNLATTWWTLSYLKSAQGDLEAAEVDARRALAIQQDIQPRSIGVADALDLLGHVQTEARRFAEGRRSLREAVALRKALVPGNISHAGSLEFLGALEVAAGDDLAEAERLLQEADALYEAVAPSSLSRAEGLAALGHAVARRGRVAEALGLARRALALRRRFAPGGLPEAESLYQIGTLEARSGAANATTDLCAAVEVIDRLGDRLAGAARARSAFTVAYGEYYSACLRARLEEGRPAEAFRVLEAGKARAMLDLFGRREVGLSELPEDLRRQRERLFEDDVALSSRLEEASAAGDAATADRLRGELLDNQQRYDALWLRIRESSSRLALQMPQPLDLAAVRKALDPGTVLLAYSLGAERSSLFVVTAEGSGDPPVRVFPIAVGAGELGREVEAFRTVLGDSAAAIAPLRRRASHLYRLLVRPAEGAIGPARRLLIVPDGPLHVLPFAALVRGDGRYLVEWKPLFKTVSATVYAELGKRRSAPSEKGWIGILGAPLHVDGRVPLPGARDEIQAISRLYAPRARLLEGRAATESALLDMAGRVEVLHLATHAYIDESRPLSSALVLAPASAAEARASGDGDGRLEAWEIAERMRFEGSLVTLSACETGLGRAMGGEGILGLTRAFQLAGARSVLASLWAVGDGATARLMPRFYRHLRDGLSKDEALRQAQIEALRDKALAHPGVWAAFELNGDDR